MITTSRQNRGRYGLQGLLSLIFLLVFSIAGADDSGQAEKPADQTKEPVDINFEVTKTDYEYQIEGRPDPFIPFFTGETKTEPTLDPNEIVDSSVNLSGMQLFEPGQLTLVALLQAKGTYVAMVEDVTGRGYIIEKGIKIGRRGIVKAILPNSVIIEEVAMTRAGKELRSEIVMALRKEGEE